MKLSATGLAIVKAFEGCYLTAYQDPVGVWTIGYGTTGAEAKPGRKITQAQADEFLRQDMEHFEQHVEKRAKVPLAQSQFDALVSWAYNTGGPATATLWKKLNAGDFEAVPDELLRWDKAGGKKLAGLTRRRQAEATLFRGDIPSACKIAGIAVPPSAPISAPSVTTPAQETSGMGKYSKAIGATVGAVAAWGGVFGVTSVFGMDLGHFFDILLTAGGSIFGAFAAPANK